MRCNRRACRKKGIAPSPLSLSQVLIALVTCLTCITGPNTLASLKPTTLEKPIFAEVTLAEGSEKVVGSLVRFDADRICIKDGKGEHELKWSDLSLTSQHAVRARIVDRSSAADLLELAALAMKCDLREQAKLDVAAAARIDPSTRLKGDAILRGTPAVPTQPVKYQKSTPEEDAKAIAVAQQVGKEVGRILDLKLAEIQTQHFIIFTDWDPREYTFLKTNCEAAYSAVSKQFEIPVAQNVFVGKLPVFMFVKHADFIKYAKNIDQFQVPDTWQGYYSPHSDGTGHLLMWKPDVKKWGDQAERVWASVLTHEFTHAFVARYRTNRRIPRWLNEGVAEVIALGEFPRPTAHASAKAQAKRKFDFQALFDDSKLPAGDMYPVMQTMVEYLISQDRKKFLKFFDDLKEGMEPEAALSKYFYMGYQQFEDAWRDYAKKL
jgi:hypothetical protein